MSTERRADDEAVAMTVLGPVASADLGIVLAHEHLVIDLPHMVESEDATSRTRQEARLTLENLGWVRQYWTWSFDNLVLDDTALAAAELGRFAAAGGGAIVDVTLPGIGRDPQALVEISQVTGVHVIMGTGAYVAGTHPDWVGSSSTEELADRFVAEAIDGVAGVRAGIIGEIGCSWPLEDDEARVLAAAAQAQRRTGLAISVHPGRDRASPAGIIDILRDNDADLERVIIGHIERTVPDHDGLLSVVSMGCTVAFDIFGLETSYYPVPGTSGVVMASDAQRLDLIDGLISGGHADRIVVSHDVCTKHRLVRYGGHGYDHLVSNVMPWMRERGVDEADLERLFVANPARMLTVAPPRH